MVREYRKSSLCRGYDQGVTCVACCINLCMDIWEIEPWVIEPLKYLSSDELVKLKIISQNDSVEQKGFDYYWQRIKERAERNTSLFKEHIEKGTPVSEIPNRYNLLGIEDGLMGCLLHKYEDPDEKIFYRARLCREYLCNIADESTNGTYLLSNRQAIFSEFIGQNFQAKQINSLSLSRIIHLLNQRPDVLEFFGFDLKKEGVAENVAQLNHLLEIVSKTTY